MMIALHRNISRCGLAILLAFALPALAAPQTAPPPKLAFDVASVKDSASLVGATRASAGLHIDGAQVHAALLSLRDYIRVAYKIQDYQISGPEWMGSSRYDIDATLPADATRDQVPEMLQALLAERFGLKFHNETKDLPVYFLQVSKQGVKMQPLPPNPEGNLDIKSPSNVDATGSSEGTTINFGNGSTISISMSDRAIIGTKITMDNLAHLLARFEDRPVLDGTGLKDIYNVDLRFAPDDFRVLLIRAAQAQGVALPPQALALLDNAGDAPLHEALGKLGLTLQIGKGPVLIMMVDQVQKPAAN
jgi:uncharacterized protein (TIGR03435 family)